MTTFGKTTTKARLAAWAPDVDDVAHRDDAGHLAVRDDHEVTEAAAGHRVGGLLQRPLAVGERRLRGEVVLDVLAVGVLAAAERPHEVALGDDAGPGLLGIHDH